MRNLRWLRRVSLLLALWPWGLLAGQAAAPETAVQTAQEFEARLTRSVNVQYWLFLPQDYRRNGDQKWPLILFLHGAGERGTDLELVKKHGPPKILEQRRDFPFIVVSPQCPRGEFWSDDALLALLDQVLAQHAVDRKRVYLTGLSMGGYGTWSLAARAPERFAAIAPICGGGMTIWGRRLRNTPVWVFHGAQDPLVPLEESERMVEALRRAGNEQVRLMVYPDAGHDSWTETYDNEQLYQWFLSHSR